jgi:hypothetical protein
MRGLISVVADDKYINIAIKKQPVPSKINEILEKISHNVTVD